MDMMQERSELDWGETPELHWKKKKKKRQPTVVPAVIGLVWMASQVLVKMMW